MATDPLSSLRAQANARGYLFQGYDYQNQPIFTNFSTLNTHAVVVGATGTGKTVYLNQVYAQAASMPGAIVVMAPDPDIIRRAALETPSARLANLVYIDPQDTRRTWGCNLLQFGRRIVNENDPDYLSKVEYILEDTVNTIVSALADIQEDVTGYETGASILSMLRMACLAAGEREDTSFRDAYGIFIDPQTREVAAATTSRAMVRDYLLNTLPKLRADYTERVRNKLDLFLHRIMINLFSRRDECESLATLLENPNTVILVNLDRSKLPPNLCSLIGFILTTLIMYAVDRRPAGSANPITLIIDEFPNFASKTTVRWFAEARKKNARLIVGLQSVKQLSPALLTAIGNAGTKCVFRAQPEDAAYFGPMFDLVNDFGSPHVAEFTMMPRYEMKLLQDEPTEQFGRRALVPRVVTVRVPPPNPLPADADAVFAAICEQSKRRWAKANNLQDLDVVLRDPRAGGRQVLEALYEGSLARIQPKGFHLPGVAIVGAGPPTPSGELPTTFVAFLERLLAAKGTQLTGSQVRQFLRFAARRRWVETVRHENQPAFRLSALGRKELGKHVSPGDSSNEGGPIHRQTLLDLYRALSSIGSLCYTPLTQKTREYTPDLIVARLSPDSIAAVMTSRKEIHFHVESSQQKNPRNVLRNLARACELGAEPIIVLPTGLGPADVLKRASSLCNALDKLTSTGRLPIPAIERPGKPRIWFVWKAELYQVGVDAKTAVAVRDEYLRMPFGIDATSAIKKELEAREPPSASAAISEPPEFTAIFRRLLAEAGNDPLGVQRVSHALAKAGLHLSIDEQHSLAATHFSFSVQKHDGVEVYVA